jgi:urease accessory protein
MAAGITTISCPAELNLLRLLQLVSPGLPVGAFAYSQGLEWAREAGWVTNAGTAHHWISGVLNNGPARLDVPVLARLQGAWEHRDAEAFSYWNTYLLASRGSAELQQEDRHMGRALLRLLRDLIPYQADAVPCLDPSFTAMFAVAACAWGIDPQSAGMGLLWAWLENQVAAAVKLVPLGQTEGQRILTRVAEEIPAAVTHGLGIEDSAIGAVTPGLALAAALHETQHTRLFRS